MTQTELLKRIDALLAEYIASGADCETPRMAAIHSPPVRPGARCTPTLNIVSTHCLGRRMTGQNRKLSAIESATSTAIGFAVSWAVTPAILSMFGYAASTGEAFGITCIYTAISFARGYVVRRAFNYASKD